MASLPELEAALVKADAAGNTEDARILANAIRETRAAAAQVRISPPPPSPPTGQELPAGMGLSETGTVPLPISDVGPLATTAAGLGLRNGLPAAGQSIGAMTGLAAPVMVPTLGGIGGITGEFLAQLLEGGKLRPGAMFAAGGLGTLPGSWIPKGRLAGAATLGAANVAAQNLESVIDTGKPASIGQDALSFGGGAVAAQLPNSYVPARVKPVKGPPRMYLKRDAVLRDLVGEGGGVDPAVIGKGSIISGIGGKAATAQQAAEMQQAIFQRLTREDLSLPGNPSLDFQGFDPLTPPTLEAIERQWVKFGYEPIANHPNNGAKLLDDWKDAKAFAEKAKKQWDAPVASDRGIVADFKEWKNREADVKRAEDAIKGIVGQQGFDDLKLAEKKLAKVHVLLEGGVNKMNGLVDGSFLAAYKQNHTESILDDNLDRIADYVGNFRREGRELSRVPAPGVDKMTVGQSSISMAQGTTPGFVAGMANLLGGKLARNYTLSPGAQQRYAAPAMIPSEEQFVKALARLAVTNETRTKDMPPEDKLNLFMQFLQSPSNVGR